MSPRIVSLECFVAAYPVVGDFRYLAPKDGKPVTRNTVIVALRDDEGGLGWGQAVPSPTWSYETIETVQTTLERHLAPALVGLPVDDTAAVWRAMNRVIAPGFSTGQPIAKAGADLALFDLQGRRSNLAPAARWGREAGGPVTLSWEDVAASGDSAQEGYNVVIHEFVHKLDMRDGEADGCPPLPTRALRQRWQSTMQASYAQFQTQLAMADRFGAEAPWLDAYAATAPAEFFAVASEAYFVNPARFAQSFEELAALLDAFFKPAS